MTCDCDYDLWLWLCKFSSIVKHLNENQQCKTSHHEKQFTILDYASSQYELALKDGLHIKWIKPILNKQKNTKW